MVPVACRKIEPGIRHPPYQDRIKSAGYILVIKINLFCNQQGPWLVS